MNRAVIFFGLGLAAVMPLKSATLIARFNGVIDPMTIQRDVGDGGGWITTSVGLFGFTRLGGTFPGEPFGDFVGFCIEPREFVTPGVTYTYNVEDLQYGATNIGGMGPARADLLRELYARYFPQFIASIPSLTARALQIATWEIVRETSGVLNVTSGTTRFRNPGDPAALTLAQTMLSSLTGTGPRLDDLRALNLVGVQDIVVQVTPEPQTLLLTGAALLMLARLGVRRRAR
jgi:hypothetical protein